ncbi:MAG: phosphatidylinositol transfer protein [Myxococcota bacterium]
MQRSCHGLLALFLLAACSDSNTAAGGEAGDGSTSNAADSTGMPNPTVTGETNANTSTTTTTSGADESTETSAAASDSTTEADGTTGGPVACEPVPACTDVPIPDGGPLLDWENFGTTAVVFSGDPRHRGRDMFYNPDEAHWAMAKFAYGPTDWDLSEERVDAYLLRNCEGDWESLGPQFTTDDGDHPTIEGVEDSGGWVFLELPESLPPGRHRIHWVVRGDGSRADTFIEVVEPGTPIILSDVDGTLTTSEWERAVDFLLDTIPNVNEGAPEALQALVDLGYRPMYLTARPEFLGNRTYEFIEARGLPPGIIHTSLSATGALGSAAVELKSGELDALASRGLVPSWVFGNTDSDAEAYENAGIAPLEQRVFFQYDDEFGGRTIDSYTDLLPEFAELDSVCD